MSIDPKKNADPITVLRTWTRLRPVQRADGGHNGCEDCGAIFGEECAPGCEVGDAFRKLRAEREEMLALLREVEWANEGDHCPACGWANPETREADDPAWIHFGHTPDCRLAAFLKET